MIIMLLFLSVNLFADSPSHWNYLMEISEQHEFYKNHESLIKPKDSWQHLFSVDYLDLKGNRLKDCVFFRVPGVDSGVLKLKTLMSTEKCADHLLGKGDSEINSIKSLEFVREKKKLRIDMSFNDYRTEVWEGKIQFDKDKSSPQNGESSVGYKTSKIILLAPKTKILQVKNATFFKEGSLCHNINDDCEERAPSACLNCENGWYEVPNGCFQSPKYCGVLRCGAKGQVACGRGVTWQRREGEFDCRENSDFAYCSPGAAIECQGKKAFCR